MAKSGDVGIGGHAIGNQIVTGKNNRVEGNIQASLQKADLPPAESVNIRDELAAIKAVLERLNREDRGKIGRAMEDAVEEAEKPEPDKDEIGAALDRALGYAKKGAGFAEEIGNLAKHVSSAVAWLGSNWHKLLGIVGLVI